MHNRKHAGGVSAVSGEERFQGGRLIILHFLQNVEEMLGNPQISPEVCLRLALLFALRYESQASRSDMEHVHRLLVTRGLDETELKVRGGEGSGRRGEGRGMRGGEERVVGRGGEGAGGEVRGLGGGGVGRGGEGRGGEGAGGGERWGREGRVLVGRSCCMCGDVLTPAVCAGYHRVWWQCKENK